MTVLRLADVAEAHAVAELHVATWRVAYRGLLPDDHLDGLSVPAREQEWARRLADGVPVLLAEQDGEVVGFASWGPSRDGDAAADVGELYALYVHPLAWGTGVGRALHDAVLTALSADRRCAVTLWVLDANLQARAFYATHGWVRDAAARTEQLSGATVTELRYRYPLTTLRLPP